MAISDEVRDRVRAQAGDRCGYCRSLQKYVLGILEIDHLIPTAKGGLKVVLTMKIICG